MLVHASLDDQWQDQECTSAASLQRMRTKRTAIAQPSAARALVQECVSLVCACSGTLDQCTCASELASLHPTGGITWHSAMREKINQHLRCRRCAVLQQAVPQAPGLAAAQRFESVSTKLAENATAEFSCERHHIRGSGAASKWLGAARLPGPGLPILRCKRP